MKSIKPVLGLGMVFERITEKESNYRHLEKMTVTELLTNINKEDATVQGKEKSREYSRNGK